MQELHMPVNMRAIITKLPYRMTEQWRTTAQFGDLVMFIERLSDPLFGDIQDPLPVSAGIKSSTGLNLRLSINRSPGTE